MGFNKGADFWKSKENFFWHRRIISHHIICKAPPFLAECFDCTFNTLLNRNRMSYAWFSRFTSNTILLPKLLRSKPCKVAKLVSVLCWCWDRVEVLLLVETHREIFSQSHTLPITLGPSMLPISIRHKNHGYFEKHLKEVDQEMKSESLQFLIPCFWSKVFQTSFNVNLIHIFSSNSRHSSLKTKSCPCSIIDTVRK